MSLFPPRGIEEQEILFERLQEVIDGTLSPQDFKKVSAAFGIYPQKQGLFMVRIRTTAGIIQVNQLHHVLNTLRDVPGLFLHLTTREALQVHNVPATAIKALIDSCHEVNLYFRGGGGDTYRNVLVNSDCGHHPAELFNVMPCAAAIHQYTMHNDHAFDLPRKLKIALSSTAADEVGACLQDLGFVASTRNGEPGFKVYVAGGMGRISKEGLLAAEFITPEEILFWVAAVVEFFHAEGNRDNRAKARLRFLREELGDDEFLLHLHHYLEEQPAELRLPTFDLAVNEEERVPAYTLPKFNEDHSFGHWLTRAHVTGTEQPLIKLWVPGGNFTVEELDALLTLCEAHQLKELRITMDQNLLIPNVPVEQLLTLYLSLRKLAVDYTGRSFIGQLSACIGATICNPGILDCPKWANQVEQALDTHYGQDEAVYSEAFKRITPAIRLSGCPNACGGHPSAQLGFEGRKTKNSEGKSIDAYRVWQRTEGESRLGTPSEIIPAEDLSKVIINWANSH